MKTITLGELREHLSLFDDDYEVFFGSADSGLEFFRTKLRGEKLVQVEFAPLPDRETTRRSAAKHVERQSLSR